MTPAPSTAAGPRRRSGGGDDCRLRPVSPSAPFFVAVVVLHLLSPAGVRALYFSDTEDSYAIFPRWSGCPNASLSFEFKTRKVEGMLWYVDDGGTTDYFEIMLENGRIKLSMKIASDTEFNLEIEAGHDLHDGNWHRVELSRNNMVTTLTVDHEKESASSFGPDSTFGDAHNQQCFVGGVPSDYRDNLERLSLPSVVLQPRFKGHLRNILYNNCTCETVRIRMVEGNDVSDDYEHCEKENPCRQHCVCLSTDTQSLCDCSSLKCFPGNYLHDGLFRS